MRRLLVLLTGVVLLSGCDGDAGAPQIVDARIGRPAGDNGALYFTALAYGTADKLVGAVTEAASAVELHETVIGPDGTAAMRHMSVLDLPRSGRLVLEPGGLHLMLIDVMRLEVGATVEVTLVWENAGEMSIEAIVVDPSETLGDHDHG